MHVDPDVPLLAHVAVRSTCWSGAASGARPTATCFPQSVAFPPPPPPTGDARLCSAASWYYATVRLPTGVHAGRTVTDLLRPTRRTICGGYLWDLPVPVQGVSTHAQGLRPRGSMYGLPMTPSTMLPSASVNGVGTPDFIISRLDGWPACAPVNASPVASRPPAHDSGSG